MAVVKAGLCYANNGEVKSAPIVYGLHDGKVVPMELWTYGEKKTTIGIDDLVYMQDFGDLTSDEIEAVIESMAMEKPYTLTDKRDNQKYVVAKLKDGNVWMCENLRLGGDSPITLTPEDSDVASEFVLPVSKASGFIGTDDPNAAYVDPTWGGYYTWYAATAGTGTGSMTSGDASSSICPKGWKLPTSGGSGGEFKALVTAYNDSSSDLRATPIPGFTLAGNYYNSSADDQGNFGDYWSSTVYGSRQAYNLALDSSVTNPTYYSLKESGYPVRGMVRREL